MNPRVPVEVRLTSDWNPSLYMKFADERMLAARDLLARVPLASARLVYDLGCGPGNSAELLSRRFPNADVIGLDTSEAMLDYARTRAPRARFVRQNIVDWVPTEPPNLILKLSAGWLLTPNDPRRHHRRGLRGYLRYASGRERGLRGRARPEGHVFEV